MKKDRQARELYIKGYTLKEIAEKVGVSVRTIQSYKKDANGEWDKAQEVYNLSPRGIAEMYLEGFRAAMLEATEKPEIMLDPAKADALSKNYATLKKIAPGSLAFGYILDFAKTTIEYLKANAPELEKQLRPHWEPIKQKIKNQLEGVFGE